MEVVKRRRKGMIDVDRSEAKTPQSSVSKDPKAKIELLEEYYNFNSWRATPVSQATLERLRDNAIKWAVNDNDALKIKQFLVLNGIAPGTWTRWKDKYPEIREAHDIMLMAIGNRREVGLVTRKFEPASTMKSMVLYDEEWKQVGEWWSNLSQKEGSNGGQQFIVLEKAANSPLVPERKEEE